MPKPVIDAVVIGRNEGARLQACLESLRGQVRRLVYVDSGSTDGSVAAARAMGAEVVAMDMTQPFTAARARNAGLAVLDTPDFVQMVDGDCEVVAGWIDAALAAYAAHPAAVVVCGRRHERFPEASVYNRLADLEWDTPLGLALDAASAQAMDLPAVSYDEAAFRLALNEDAMATEKLAEGIRAFCADAVKLEELMKKA